MRALRLPSGASVILSDTVGFITDLPTTLVAAFRATLEEVLSADLSSMCATSATRTPRRKSAMWRQCSTSSASCRGPVGRADRGLEQDRPAAPDEVERPRRSRRARPCVT